MKDKLARKLKWKHILLLLLAFLCMMACMRYSASRVKSISGGTRILDLNPGNSVTHIRQTMQSLGEEGRKYYVTRFLVIDDFYAMTYAMFYFCTILFLLHQNGVRKKVVFDISFLPVVGMVFDWLENLFLRFLILNWTGAPDDSSIYVIMSRLFLISNRIKFIAVYLSLSVVMAGLIFCFYKRVFLLNFPQK